MYPGFGDLNPGPICAGNHRGHSTHLPATFVSGHYFYKPNKDQIHMNSFHMFEFIGHWGYEFILFNRNTPMGSGGNEKLPPRRIPTVGIVWKVPSTQTQLSHKHHHHGGAVFPSYGVVSLDTPDRTRTTSLEGVGQERFSLV
jgi:hypothetical protein